MTSGLFRVKAGVGAVSKAAHLFLFVFAVLLAAVGGASAEELPSPTDPTAKTHLLEGNKAYRLKEFDVAIREYRAGAATEVGSAASFTFWWNLGQAYRMQARYEEAIWFYGRFLEKAPLSYVMHRDAAKGFIDEMNREMDKAATKTGPTEPAPSPLPANNEERRVPPPDFVKAAASSRWYDDKPGWALTGVGLVASGIGTGFLLSGSSLYGQAEDEDRQDVRANLEDRAATRVLVGGIVAGVGVAALTTGVIKLAFTPDRAADSTPVQVTVGPSWFGIRGSF